MIQTIKSIDEADRATLENLRTQSNTAGMFAKNMLSIAEGVYFEKIMPMDVPIISNKKKERILNYEVFQSNAQFLIYPNPSKSVLNIETKEAEFGQQTTLKMYDIVGREVYRQLLNQNEKRVEANVNELVAGVYTISIFQNEKKVFSTAHVIVK